MREFPFGEKKKTETNSSRCVPSIQIHKPESLSTFKCAIKNTQWILVLILACLSVQPTKYFFSVGSALDFILCVPDCSYSSMFCSDISSCFREDSAGFLKVFIFICARGSQTLQVRIYHILTVPRPQSRRFSFISGVGMHLKMGTARNYDNHNSCLHLSQSSIFIKSIISNGKKMICKMWAACFVA